jgi:hypothetical protein
MADIVDRALQILSSTPLTNIKGHPLAADLLRVMGISAKSNPADVMKILNGITERRGSVVNPADIWKINDPKERARQIAMLNKYNVSTGSDKNLIGGYYNIKQGMAPADVKTTIGDIPNAIPKPANKMSWEDALSPYAGGTLIGLGGDRSRLGRITHINNKKLSWPVDLHAGVDYMREPNKGQVWANAKAHSSTLEKMIGKAAEKGPIIGAFQPMGPQSLDSSHHMFDALMAQVDKKSISKEDAKAFDDALKNGLHMAKADRAKGAQAMEDWPGILNAKKASDFAKSLPGTHRSSIVKLMDTATWRDRGFPLVGVTRAAITEPDLLSARNNTVGHRMVELDPDELMRNARDTGFTHSTYNVPTGGRYHADVPLLPRQDVFAEHEAAMLGKTIKGGYPVHAYSDAPLGRSTYRKMTEEQKPWSPINQSMIDRTASAEQNIGKTGYKRGGSAKNISRALSLTSLYALGHDRDAG